MAHYNREQITIIHAFASDHTSGQQTFYIDKNWSGTSSGIQLPNHRGHEQTNVSRLTIDSLFIHEDLNEQKLLFKIDVEGYEAFVLKGMQRLFKKCQHTFGIIEFDSLYMGKAGIQMDEFFSCLSDHFTVYVFKEDKQLIKMEELSLNWLQQYYNSNEIHTDLILTTNESELPGLGFTLLHSI
jgi:FkbM family methyltransferase